MDHPSALAAARSPVEECELLKEVWHELRTPVAAIKALAAVLGADLSPEDRREATELVAAHADHLGALLNAISDVATRRQDHLDAADVGLADGPSLVRAAASAAGLESARLQLAWTGDCLVRTDRPALRQVFTNLLENARVHGLPETPVSVALRRVPRWLSAVVINPLPEVPAPAGGMGVGLAVTRRLVRRLGGELHVEDSAASVFRVTVTVPVI